MHSNILATFEDKINLMNFLTRKTITSQHTQDEAFNIIKNQALRVIEEAKEVVEACEAKDIENLLKEIIDVSVTSIPLLEMGEKVGCNVEGALIAVADNNLTKVTRDVEVAINSLEHYGEEEYYLDKIKYHGEYYYCIKRISDDKYMKPLGYQSVDLSSFVQI